MSVVKNIMLEYYNLITELNTSFCQEHGVPLFIDLPKLQHSLTNSEVDGNTITYDTPLIEIRNYFTPSHTIPSNAGITYLDIGISLKNITIREVKELIEDPVLKLDGFDIVIKTQHSHPNYYVASWHLDKRIQSPTYSLLEPEYHITYGGRKMEELHASNWDFGSSLIMRSPRIMHPPMDIILGIDFILNQFIPIEFSGDILKNGQYKNIIGKMKNILWRPYAMALAKSFYRDWNAVSTLSFDNNFCNNIIGN